MCYLFIALLSSQWLVNDKTMLPTLKAEGRKIIVNKKKYIIDLQKIFKFG